MNDLSPQINKTMEYSQHFGQDVYHKQSGVQVPIEIYEGCEYF